MSHTNYIATWFYKENSSEASYYPQLGRRGDSPLLHSVYMKIQIPFFVTFAHYNPDARLLFFTNTDQLPPYLMELFAQHNVELVRLDYHCAPPKGWHSAWTNQFYLYDILQYMGKRMEHDDVLLVSDADCICQRSLAPFFDEVRQKGSGLYDIYGRDEWEVNGVNGQLMADIYEGAFGTPPSAPMRYYGGDFIALRGDKVEAINEAYRQLWPYNLKRFGDGLPKLNEEAHLMSTLAERLALGNAVANGYFKRIWTHPDFNNCQPADRLLTVWHLPYEKRRGLTYLYNMLCHDGYRIADEQQFWDKASYYCGVPTVTRRKKLRDLMQKVSDILFSVRTGIS